LNAQTITVYDDALQNSFNDFSYGGGVSLLATAQVHSGTKSISLTGVNGTFNAVSLEHVAAFSTATYPVIHFWVNGGANSGQQIEINLYDTDAHVAAQAALDGYISGGSIAANTWREVTVSLTQGALSYNGNYTRFDLQNATGTAQPVVYFDDITLTQASAPVSPAMQIEHDVSVVQMTSDRFTWRDSANKPRVAVLSHNDGQVGPGGSYGGSLREFRYQLPNDTQRIAGLTGYGIGDAGFGYVVSHSHVDCGIDDSNIGGYAPGNGFERVFEGRHHAIFRFHQNYPINCTSAGTNVPRTIPVTIEWMFSTGQDNPVWSITWDIDQSSPAVVAGTLYRDSRAPYGELAIDGDGSAAINGTAWGDRYKFTSMSDPFTMDSAWDWSLPNTVPYVKEWLNAPLTVDNKHDATMGIVQTQTNAQQDAGGGRETGTTNFWGSTSALSGNACGAIRMICADDWAYQANANSLDFAYTQPGDHTSNNARMTWKTQWGFIGQGTYPLFDKTANTAPGYPKKSYSTFIVLGTHSSGPVEAQVGQVETIQHVTFTPTIGSVVTSGPAGNVRADTVTYDPAGYNHVYGALALRASNNQIDMNIAISAGTLKHPLIIVSNYTSGNPQTVRLQGTTLTADADYYASLRPAAAELWITLNANLTGPTNRLEISGGGFAAPANFIATAASASQVSLTWTAVGGAATYDIHRGTTLGTIAYLTTTGNTSATDNGLAANTTYLYKVTVTGSPNFSPVDAATTIVFANDPLNAGTPIQAVHITQLRTAVNAMRAAAGQGPFAFTDLGLAAGTTLKAAHIIDLRTALDQARGAIGLPALVYTDPAIAAGVTTAKAVHITNLRDGVK
jgi:hypothetical protein